MTNPRDIDFYGHMIIIPLVPNPVMVWNSHNGAPSNKRRKYKTFLIPEVLSCLFKKWYILNDKKVTLQKSVPGICSPQRETCFLFFSLKPRWPPPQQNVKSLGMVEGSPFPYYSILLSTHVDWLFQIHYGIKGFCGQPWESHHLWPFLWGKLCFEFWMTDF